MNLTLFFLVSQINIGPIVNITQESETPSTSKYTHYPICVNY
jgi:hypothetical protein